MLQKKKISYFFFEITTDLCLYLIIFQALNASIANLSYLQFLYSDSFPS